MSLIKQLLEETRKRLVETGTRNRLIHVNRNTKRGSLVNIINERSDDIYNILKLSSKKMRFAGKGVPDEDEINDDIILAIEEDFDEERFTDSILETNLTPDALQKRLLKVASDSRTVEEEQGINILFLAMGFLRWYEDDKSDILRESPLIMLPVQLVRNQRTSSFDLQCRDDDIVTNLPLQERMKNDFGVDIPEIDDSEDWIPSDYFKDVADTLSGKERWSIDKNGMQLGFFSFAKLLMLRDLDPENWRTIDLTENQLIKNLLCEGFHTESSLFSEGENIDDKLNVKDIFQVIDADSSQTKVIEEVNQCRNLVVQGPPGTGKSQTITNILTIAAHKGKKVLFVAEKMAALNVVHDRLVKVGLNDLCVELHSRSANKKAFLTELTITLSNAEKTSDTYDINPELTECRDKLNSIANVLHSRVPDRDYTPYEVLSKLSTLMGQGVAPPEIELLNLEKYTYSEIDNIIDSVKTFSSLKEQYGDYHNQPFFGVNNLDLQPFDLQRLKTEIVGTKSIYTSWRNYADSIARFHPLGILTSIDEVLIFHEVLEHFNVKPAVEIEVLGLCFENKSDQRFYEGIQYTNDWINEYFILKDEITDSLWALDLIQIRLGISRGVKSWFNRIFGGYRKISNQLQSTIKKPLPKSPSERLKLVDKFIEGHEKKELYESEEHYLESKLGAFWRGIRTDINSLNEGLKWIENAPEGFGDLNIEQIAKLTNANLDFIKSEKEFKYRENLIQKLNSLQNTLEFDFIHSLTYLEMNLEEFIKRISNIERNIESYSHWIEFHSTRKILIQYGIKKYLEANESGQISNENLIPQLTFSIFEEKWNICRTSFPKINEIAKLDRHVLVSSFIELEQKKINATRELIKNSHLKNLPKGAAGEMGVIKGEIAKKRRHKSIRYLMTHAGNMIQRIKPIFLMSPISVAQYLPPEKLEFDLLVIDEASQVRPEDALGSIARAKQIVVVGDQKQLPPTSFFDRLTDNIVNKEEDDEEEIPIVKAVEMESILSLCEARGMNQRMLKWHYRSRDPSLITVSNLEFYKNELILPPCPTKNDDFFGLSLKRVPGAYSSASKGSGRTGTNKIEAEKIAERIIELSHTRPEYSVGVATFSKSQADMVTDVLEFRRRKNDTLDKFLREDKVENLFVKNIENVQGDERDIILISVGYGPYEPNQPLPSMSFGPVNSEGGERRLNVLFSRSRVACQIFCSFDPSEIDLSRTSKIGPGVLKKFLQFAEKGYLPDALPVGDDPDSDFEIDVANEIRKLGYVVDYQVGTAGFKIDLGVRKSQDSEHYLLAVESDGATYHSALWARERDRLRQQILEGFGWKFHRIWSTDWFYKRDKEVTKLKEVLEKCSELEVGIHVKGTNNIPPKDKETKEIVDIESFDISDNNIKVPVYKKAHIQLTSNQEPHERSIDSIAQILNEIVTIEGLIHIDELARRYASAHGKNRMGNRILEVVKKGVRRSVSSRLLQKKGDFVGTTLQFENPHVRDRSNEKYPLTKPEYISPNEIYACANLITSECGEMSLEELSKSVSRVLGFKRTGPELQERIGSVLRDSNKL